MKVVIIEDEKLTAADLAKTIKSIEPDIEIVSLLYSVEESVLFFQKNKEADLIFSDIQLSDGLSFDIFEKIKIEIPVIFCTAFDQYSLDAFKTYGIDYILKPFTKASVNKALTKYKNLKEKFNQSSESRSETLVALKEQFIQRSPSIIIHQGEKIIPIKGADIALFFIDRNILYAYTFQQQRYVVSQSLDALEKIFFPAFFRINRHSLVNRKAVTDASHFFNRKLRLNLNVPFKEELIVGKLKAKSFLEWLSLY